MAPSLLVVDDDPDIREVLALALEQRGYAVATAVDGTDALRVLRQASTCPGLIFLDLRMPGMNGWQFLEALDGEQRCADVPVIVITADRSPASQSVRGAAGILTKPLGLPQLLRTVAQYVGVP